MAVKKIKLYVLITLVENNLSEKLEKYYIIDILTF